MNRNENQQREILEDIANRAMLARGLLPDFSPEAIAELDKIQAPATAEVETARDLRPLLWASIDNDDSRDLDQLTVAKELPEGKTKVMVAIADVDALIKKGSAIDEHAGRNTTSIYTAAKIFPMLPEKLSTNLTSLNFNEDRLAVVVEMVVGADGSLGDSDVYQAIVRNHAKLAYNSVASWLDGGAIPPAVAKVSGLAENLRLQDKTAQTMKDLRQDQGALSLETIEARPVFEGDSIRGLQVEEKNRAKDIIEDFMIAANGVTVRYLSSRKIASIRRVVRVPKRWDRIVEIAAEHRFRLPGNPDPKALEGFLTKMRALDPIRFPDLSLVIIKLLGSGEYLAELPEDTATGHFGLAVKDYTHSTAPNRRYPDLITQRLLKAAIAGKPMPYSKKELDDLAAQCTEQEDAANKVERQVGKSAAALLLESRIGEKFEALVTGASAKGNWVRLLDMPIEGMLKSGFEGIDVGDQIRVQLISVDIERGFIDFARIDQAKILI